MFADRQGCPPTDRWGRAVAKPVCPMHRSNTTGRCRWRAWRGCRCGVAPTGSGRRVHIARAGEIGLPEEFEVARRIDAADQLSHGRQRRSIVAASSLSAAATRCAAG